MIKEAFTAGRLAWPELSIPSLKDFTQHVHGLNVTDSDLEQHGAELYLALACGKAAQEALGVLQRCFFPALNDYLTRSGFDAATRQDVFQQLLLHLCTGECPRILTYAGRAALTSWLRVSTFRFAVNHSTQNRQFMGKGGEVTFEHLISPNIDPETRSTIEATRPLFQLAIQRVMSELPDRDRTLLRLCFLDGLSIDGIGSLYCVHRATAARWICDIRRRILENVRRILGTEFGIRASEFESLVYLVHSELHLSLSRVLGAA